MGPNPDLSVSYFWYASKRTEENLFNEKNVSEEFLDNAELAVLQQEAIVGQRAVGVQRAEHEAAESRLLAPYDGVVSNVNANLGHSASNQGEKLADLVDTSKLEYIEFNKWDESQ